MGADPETQGIGKQPKLKRAICRVCGTTGEHQEYVLREMMFGMREIFVYTLCDCCGCLQIDEVPYDLSRHYPSNYYSLSNPVIDSGPSRFRVLGWRKLALDRLRGHQTLLGRVIAKLGGGLADSSVSVLDYLRRAGIRDLNRAILDVGCGRVPARLRALRACGFWNLVGVDPFIEADVERCGVKVYRGDLNVISGQFDLIMFHHSFEHLDTPHQTLEKAVSLLNPGGVLLIRTPVMGSYLWEKYGVNWVELDAPRHLIIYSRTAMSLLAEKHHLELFDSAPDSSAWELIASEQYKQDIPWRAPHSYQSAPEHSIFQDEDLMHFEQEVEKMNRAGNAGRAGFYFRKYSPSGTNF